MRTRILSILTSLLISLFAINASATQVKALPGIQNPKDSVPCYEIILKNGTIIKANIKKISDQAIEYTRCNSSTPIYSISRSNVLSIKHPDGTIEKIGTISSIPSTNSNNGLIGAIISFSLSILGLIVFPFILGLTAVIWGSISLGKMVKNNTPGKGFAYAAIIIGILDILAAIVILSLSL